VTTESIIYLLPETFLVVVATLIVVVGTIFEWRATWSWIGIAGLLIATPLVWWGDTGPLPGILVGDSMAQFIRYLTLGTGILFLLAATHVASLTQTAEYVGSLLFALTGLMVIASAQDLTLLFVGLELVSIPTYILLYLGGRDVPGQESTTKYFFLSVFSSAVTLYGFAFLYGVGGSTNLAEIYDRLTGGMSAGFHQLGALALVLVFTGLAFKIAAVPFHFYAPDVYQGTSPLNAGLLAVVPKIAGVVVMARILAYAMPSHAEVGWHLTIVIAAVTMTLGNTLALWQDNIRRLLAYSSIAHAGYMLIGLTVALASQNAVESVAQFNGIAAMLFYLAVYAVATTGTFAALTYLGGDGRPVEKIDDLAGTGRARPLVGLAVAVFMFSLAGIPPLAGFWGKLSLFASAIGFQSDGDGAQLWLVALAIIGLINAAVAAAYYLRVVAVMYFRDDTPGLPAEGGFGAFASAVACAVLLLVVGLYPRGLISATQQAAAEARNTIVEPGSQVAQSGAADLSR